MAARCSVSIASGIRRRSAVHPSFEALANETNGLDPEVERIVSDVVFFVVEVRAFVLDGVVRACAIYEASTGAMRGR